MSRVTIRRSPGKRIAGTYFPISMFLPILEDYAHIWDVDIIAQWPKYQNGKGLICKEKTVIINFFHEKDPAVDDLDLRGVKSSAFGYVFADEVACVKPNIYSGLTRIQRLELFDFDDTLLAHVDHEGGESITIDFDFLRTCWDGHEDVLRIILAWGLSQTSAKLDSFAQVDRFAEYLKKRSAQIIANERSKFVCYQQQVARESVEYYVGKLSESVRRSVESEAWYVRATRRLEEFDAVSLEIVDAVKSDQFADDFDRMRNLFGVAKISIEHGRIIIMTHRLEQIYPPPYAEGFSGEVSRVYDVGSIKFTIDPAYGSYHGIEFEIYENGEYKNAYFQGKGNMCLGTSTVHGGMNMTVAKLIIKFKIPDIVALILTFFRFVHAEPVKNPDFIGEEEEYNHVSARTEEAWKLEKQAYVEVMVDIVKKQGKRERDTIRGELSTEQMNAFSAAKNCWIAAAELERVRLRIGARAVYVAEEALELVDELEKHPAVLGFDLQHGLRIWFEHRNVFMFPSLLWIQENGSVHLVTLLTSHGRARNNAVLWDWRGDKAAMELVAYGEYADLVFRVMELTTYWLERSHYSYEG